MKGSETLFVFLGLAESVLTAILLAREACPELRKSSKATNKATMSPIHFLIY